MYVKRRRLDTRTQVGFLKLYNNEYRMSFKAIKTKRIKQAVFRKYAAIDQNITNFLKADLLKVKNNERK